METSLFVPVDVDCPADCPMDVDLEERARANRRRRTKRACDRCSISRTRCDGEMPCRRCEEYGKKCVYNREVKKRGRGRSSDMKTATFHGLTSPVSAGQAHFPLLSPPFRRAGMPPSLTIPPPDHVGSLVMLPTTPSSAHTPTFVPAMVKTQQLVSMLDGSPERAVLTPIQESCPEPLSVTDSSPGYSPQTSNGMFGRHCQRQRPNVQRSLSSVSCSSSMTGAQSDLPRLERSGSMSSDCRYQVLEPLLPYLMRDMIPASVACDLLDVACDLQPGSSLFKCASPYVLTRVFRKKSLLSPNPRPCTAALLATMLHCAALTADIPILHVPGSRSRITNALFDLATGLISDRDPDRWRRVPGGLCAEKDQSPQFHHSATFPPITATNEPTGEIDDVLTLILLSTSVSGGDFKTDCLKWWNKATRLALSLKMNREDECSASFSPCVNPLCCCQSDHELSPRTVESKEERRRVFWLLFCLDKHFSLCFNTTASIPDSYCEIYAPLPEAIWENLDNIDPMDLPPRTRGPPTTITGTGFFEYFLPLMAILGDIVEVHHRRQNPRLGHIDDSQEVAVITNMLSTVEHSLDVLAGQYDNSVEIKCGTPPQRHSVSPRLSGGDDSEHTFRYMSSSPGGRAVQDRTRTQLVVAYSTHIVHVLHVLLHGKWDAISMLDDEDDDWITTPRFHACASHAIAASQAVSEILKFDPELTFMPYLFGIYLLHGSFILLLFADRMPQLGPNQSVEQACETIIRAHEVCVVTLSTEFQKNFRKVLRSTLYSVRGSSPTEWEEHKARRQALSLYRWTKGAKGLGL